MLFPRRPISPTAEASAQPPLNKKDLYSIRKDYHHYYQNLASLGSSAFRIGEIENFLKSIDQLLDQVSFQEEMVAM